MAEESSRGEPNLEEVLPSHVLNALRDNGIDLTNEKIAHAIHVTVKAKKRAEEKPVAEVPRLPQVISLSTMSEIEKIENELRRMERDAAESPKPLQIADGTRSASETMRREIDELRKGVTSLEERVRRLVDRERQLRAEDAARDPSNLRSTPLFGVGIGAAIAVLLAGYETFATALRVLLRNWNLPFDFGLRAYAPLPNGFMAPVFVYIVYFVITIAYVGCLLALFFSRDPKNRSSAMEIVKLMTVFFIGSVAGRLI